MTLEQLSWYVDNNVSRRLLGVRRRRRGHARRRGRSQDPRRSSIRLRSRRRESPPRRSTSSFARPTSTPPAGAPKSPVREQSVRVLGNARTAYDLSQTQIVVPGGRTVRLADLGEVRDAYSEQRTIAKMNGRQVISFNVQRSKGASEVTAYDDAWRELRKVEKDDPRVKFVEIVNQVDYTKSQYHSAIEGLVEGAVLAVLVVFLFLRDFRATLISALAIPLSAIPAFWFMGMMGITLNGLSLLALSLVAGVLVDDAIVEIENIVRHMRMGKSAYQAAMDAADEIGLAVVATTMSIVAVFLPVALMPGISGQFFKSFGYTVVIAVLMSLFVARMITPLIAAYFLKSHGVQEHASGIAMDKYLGVLRWSLDTGKADARREASPSARFDWLLWLHSDRPRPSGRHCKHRRCGRESHRRCADELSDRHFLGVDDRDRRRRPAVRLAGAGRAPPQLCPRRASQQFHRLGALRRSPDPRPLFRPPRVDDRCRHRRVRPAGRSVHDLVHVIPASAESRTSQVSASACRQARRSSRPKRSPTARRKSSRKIPTSIASSSGCSSARASSSGAQGGSHGHLDRVRAIAHPQAVGDPRCAGQFPEPGRRRARRRRARHRALPGQRQSRIAGRDRQQGRVRNGRAQGTGRAARHGRPRPSGNPDQAAVRSCRRSRRHDQRAGPDDPHRDPGRHRPEQRQILASPTARCRSPSPFPRNRAATWQRSKICPCRPPLADPYP